LPVAMSTVLGVDKWVTRIGRGDGGDGEAIISALTGGDGIGAGDGAAGEGLTS